MRVRAWTEFELLGTAEAAFELVKALIGGLLINADNVCDSGFCGGVVDVRRPLAG